MTSSREIFIVHLYTYGFHYIRLINLLLPIPIPTPVWAVAVSTTYSKVRSLTGSGQQHFSDKIIFLYSK